MNAEEKRLEEDKKKSAYWKKWGPYLAERQWGTVREDYSVYGEAWDYFTHDMARSRAYRWGEDGIAGLSDNHQRLCFAFAFWNEKDSILKERSFGLSNSEGNHGEDIKEYFYYLDATPTHSYMKYLYKYPQDAYPYDDIVKVNKEKTQKDREYKLIDTGLFNKNRYFDIFIEYIKDSPEDIYVYLTAFNRGEEKSVLHVLPTIWFRNTWSWKTDQRKPLLRFNQKTSAIVCEQASLGNYALYGKKPFEALFTENETNQEKLFGAKNITPFVKDAFHEYIIHGKKEAINQEQLGTKACFHHILEIEPHQSQQLIFRLTVQEDINEPFLKAKEIYKKRKDEADEFYEKILPKDLSDDHKNIERQALAGMLWSKQFYHYVIEEWIYGDGDFSKDALLRKNLRNQDWLHLYNEDILSVPDKWEYPWFAAWDLAFHCLTYALVDEEFAKRQLVLLTREWYMHPNGQIPAYEWNFDDINPPVHAWAAWRVYKMEKKRKGKGDHHFLESVFQKLLLNFTWWVNREDERGRNVFKGGFLGLDNISAFNRSEHLPEKTELYQSDATSWMGMYCLNMLTIAFELALTNPSYEDMASKFYEHYLYIAEAINYEGKHMPSLWDEEDGFYYDIVMFPDGSHKQLKVKSLVGLMPILSVTTIEEETLDKFQDFAKRFKWFLNHRQDLTSKVACLRTPGTNNRRILSMLNKDKLQKVLKVMLNEEEFLSPYGIRAISKSHEKQPFVLQMDGHSYSVDYEPGESTNKLFGGNSNWRGPIWMPINLLIIESLQKYHFFYGDTLKVECPTGSNQWMNLWEVSLEISRRLVKIFTKTEEGIRPLYAQKEKFQKDSNFCDYIFFHEYFHGDTGEGLGASHQTGWSGCIAKLIHQLGEHKGLL